MDGNLIKQSILPTTIDIGALGVDDVYGWDLLNVEKAINGPTRFDKGLVFADNVTVNIPNGRYEFSNDIDCNAGLVKNGRGELVLSGASTFEGVNNEGTFFNQGYSTINNNYTTSAQN